jgi:hypothetical protein
MSRWWGVLGIINTALSESVARLALFDYKRKFIAMQIITYQNRISFLELDSVAIKLWRKGDVVFLPTETKILLFNSRSELLSERDRHLKLMFIVSKARQILRDDGCLVAYCEDHNFSQATGWQKTELEKLLDMIETAAPHEQKYALERFCSHKLLPDFLKVASERGHHDLVARALSALAKGG